MKKTCCLILFMLLFGLTLAACSPQPVVKQVLTPISVQLQWTHQAEFAGYYAADQNGYYADEGLKVTFLEGGSTVDNLASVVNGQAQFGTASAEQLISARAEGQPLQAIATIYRRNPAVFFSLAKFGITSPQDFIGKTIRGTSTTDSALHAMTSFLGISPDQYTVVSLPSDVKMFLTGDVPVWSAYSTGLLIAVQQEGVDLNIIYPDEYGVHFYADTIFSTDDLIKSDPDLVLRFLRASLKGWTYAVENPEEAAAMVVKYAPTADTALETSRMTTSIPLINIGTDHIGWMTPEIWAGMAKTLQEQGIITSPLDVSQVYTMNFLEEIYK
ncbi:MAG: ABC transporter substrate-binding protein [Anaerolineaceae bacterium]